MKFIILTIGFSLAMMVEGSRTTVLAVLGEAEESVEVDRQKLSGTRETLVHQQYTVETIHGPGLEVHEYVAQNGTIFAVSWKGNRIPDLATLFGSYFNEYQQTLAEWRKSVPRRRGPLHLESAHLIVETGGRRPALWGRAFVPSLLPSGVRQEQIQ